MQDSERMRQTFFELWGAACMGRPARPSCRIEEGFFAFTITGHREDWVAIAQACGVPAEADQTVDADRITFRWPSYADAIFGPGGLIAKKLGSAYEVRLPQLYMARLTQRAIEMKAPAMIEAGTGVGKSFAYAAICLAAGKRAVISTSNKALQAQLWDKDLPFLLELFPGRKAALAVGKSNYVCRRRMEDPLSGTYATSREELLDWYASTPDGNLETIPFAVDREELGAINADDSCLGRHCPAYSECFYYKARAARQNADIVVTNHALLCLHQLYPSAGLLPEAEVIVVDEAHKLPEYARGALGKEITQSSIARTLRKALRRPGAAGALADALAAEEAFGDELFGILRASEDAQIGIRSERSFESGLSLSKAAFALAEEVWREAELPSNPEEKAASLDASAIRSLAENIEAFSGPAPAGIVRWLERSLSSAGNSMLKLCLAPHDVSRFIAALAGLEPAAPAEEPRPRESFTHCHLCGRKLTAERVSILGGLPFGPDCIRKADPLGDAEELLLTDWLAAEHAPTPAAPGFAGLRRPTIFCSATLAAPDMEHALRSFGIPAAFEMVAASPFDYASNAILYIPTAAAPAPADKEYLPWLIEELDALVTRSKGGAFLLFTSNANLAAAARALRPRFEERGLTTLLQGELPKAEISRRFREDGNAVLFATKSFFEGVSIDGPALRLVCIDKLPFAAPSPLSAAMDEAVREEGRKAGLPAERLKWLPFDKLALPQMTIELKQGTGRLIRTQSDWGVMAILDSRLRTARYGQRSVLPSLPEATLTSSPAAVGDFYRLRQAPAPAPARALPTVEERLSYFADVAK